MVMEGADVAQLRALATQLTGSAERFDVIAKSLHSLVNGSMQWRGPDAERFRSEWNGASAHVLSRAAQALRDMDKVLRRNADEQVSASGAGSSAPAGAGQLFSHIRNDQHDSDGIRTETVIGRDGQTRLIVYIKGQGVGEGRDEWRSAGIAGGLVGVDEKMTRAIEDALRKTPGGTKTEVMLVGLSQGGMDAQNIASSGKYNVTTLMTYGAPIIQADDPKIATVHIRAEGDPVPAMGEAAAAARKTAANPLGRVNGVAVGAVFVANLVMPRSDNVFTYDSPNDGEWFSVHEKGYPDAAAGFDTSNDSRFDDVKKNMKKFEGPVTVATD
ncbi:WXG100 family type VII secretion target [Mycolicibacterium frederiksbergense]|uniref:WXG100 family type VII secretion target n=2 Tax=Mycolicibacterium frederiksbergense TaxID=117567 RepID=UPI0021F27E3C|nr:hypothetical protein [Mycolicibacterium frederiksbergense]